jgi:uncharacterized membrane protein
VLLVARRRPWLRSHAWQGLVLGVAAAVLVAGTWLGGFALEAAGLPSLGLPAVAFQIVVLAAYLALGLRSMVHAYHRRDAALPLVGARVRRWSGLV